MIIGFSGVSSTGKSTLAAEVARVRNMRLLTTGMKDIYQSRRRDCRLPTFDKLTDWQRIEMQRDMMRLRSSVENQHDNFVADGTPLDEIAFWLEWSTRGSVPPAVVADLINLRARDLVRYDVIFQCPFGAIPIENDGRRLTNPDFLLKMSWVLRGVTGDPRFLSLAKVFVVKSVPIESRVAEVTAIIDAVSGMM